MSSSKWKLFFLYSVLIAPQIILDNSLPIQFISRLRLDSFPLPGPESKIFWSDRDWSLAYLVSRGWRPSQFPSLRPMTSGWPEARTESKLNIKCIISPNLLSPVTFIRFVHPWVPRGFIFLTCRLMISLTSLIICRIPMHIVVYFLSKFRPCFQMSIKPGHMSTTTSTRETLESAKRNV